MHLHVLLEGAGSLLDPDCFIPYHGETLHTLVWEQGTGRRKNVRFSTNVGHEDQANYSSYVFKIATGCESLRELGLVFNVADDGASYNVCIPRVLHGISIDKNRIFLLSQV